MFFNFKKEYYSCEWLEHGIHFAERGLYHCCECFHPNYDYTPVAQKTPLNTYDYKTFFKRKKLARKSIKKEMLLACADCHKLEKKVWNNKDTITQIAISANTTCNADCIYCASHMNKKFLNAQPDTEIYSFLAKQFKMKKIDKKCDIQFGGGEPTMHFEFEKVLTLFINNTSEIIKIHSSGIKYSNAIEELIKKGRCLLVISVDSGNSELYKQIKNVDKSDIVWENIKKYCDAQNSSNNNIQVYTKYMIIPGLNDKQSYIEEFVEKSKNAGITAIYIDLESNWFFRNKNNKEEIHSVIEIVKLFEKLSKENNLLNFNYSSVKEIIKSYSNLHDNN